VTQAQAQGDAIYDKEGHIMTSEAAITINTTGTAKRENTL